MKIEVNVTGIEPLVKVLKELTEATNNISSVSPLTSQATNETAATVEEVRTSATEEKTKTITLEQVRAKLAALTQSGKQSEVKALIKKYGGKKLSDIQTDKYSDLIKDAEEI